MTNTPMTACLFLGMLIPTGYLFADPIVFHNVKVQVEAQEEEKPKLLPNPVELMNKPATAPVMNATATQISIPSLRPEERATVELGSPKVVDKTENTTTSTTPSTTTGNEVTLKNGPVRPVQEQAREVKAVVNDVSEVASDDVCQAEKKPKVVVLPPKVVVLPPKVGEENSKVEVEGKGKGEEVSNVSDKSSSVQVAKDSTKKPEKVVEKVAVKGGSKKSDLKKGESKKEIAKAPAPVKPVQPILVTSKADVGDAVPAGAGQSQYEAQGAALSSGFNPPPPSSYQQVDPSPATGYSESEVSSLLDAARGQRDPTITPTFDPPVVGKVW